MCCFAFCPSGQQPEREHPGSLRLQCTTSEVQCGPPRAVSILTPDCICTLASKAQLPTCFPIYPLKMQAESSRTVCPLTLYILVVFKKPQTEQNLKRQKPKVPQSCHSLTERKKNKLGLWMGILFKPEYSTWNKIFLHLLKNVVTFIFLHPLCSSTCPQYFSFALNHIMLLKIHPLCINRCSNQGLKLSGVPSASGPYLQHRTESPSLFCCLWKVLGKGTREAQESPAHP